MSNLTDLKICFIAGTLGQGGAERQLFYILQALRQNGAIPSLLCLDRHQFWEERIKDLGVPVTWIGQTRSRLGRLLRIAIELRKSRPSIFQSQHFFTNAYVGVAGRCFGMSNIGALRSNGEMDLRDCGRMGGKLNLALPQIIAANSRAAMEYAMRQGSGPDRLFMLRNVVDTAVLRSAPESYEGPIRLISVGRLVPLKRFDRFILLVARLRQKMGREVTGTIVGSGPLKDELETQVRVSGLPPNSIRLLGGIANMGPIYRQADILVMTSEYEGTPNVLLEAMASGLPVVATNVGGLSEIVSDNKTGFLVDVHHEEDLCAAVTRLIDDPQLRRSIGGLARGYVEANHSLDCLPGILSRLYQLALARQA